MFVGLTGYSVKRNLTGLNNLVKNNENFHDHCISVSLLCTLLHYGVMHYLYCSRTITVIKSM
jgi:hypothetical protein